jgi:hypothetical protein
MRKRIDLTPYITEMKNGATDEQIAERVGCSIGVVRKWRTAMGIKKPGGVLGNADVTRQALQLLSPTYEPARHIVGNAFGGHWKVPEYVLRIPLDYTGLCIVIDRLGGTMTDAEISSAIGIAEYDIGNARAAYARYVALRCVPCPLCGIKEPRHRCRGTNEP